MGIQERMTGTIEGWSTAWGDRLRSWLVSFLSFGLELFMDIIGHAAAPKLRPLVDLLERTGQVPPELQPILDELKTPTGEVAALFANSASGALIGGALGKIIDAIFLPMAYNMNAIASNVKLNPEQYITLWLRGVITSEELEQELKWLGIEPKVREKIKELYQVRLNVEAVSKLWLRDKTKYATLWQDLKDSGVSPERIAHFKELSHVLPTPQEVVLFMGREAFEEDSVTKYGLDAEFDRLDLKWFEQVGIRPEIAKLYWRSHWQHPAFREMTELLHRGEVTQEDVSEWYRLVEIPPHWRDKLTSISWDLPNRIELRMMARYGLVDKPFLLEQLKMVGLREDFRDVAADMMLAMGIRTDLSTRYSKGWIDAAGVQADLAASGLSAEVQTRMYQWIVKNVSTERVVKERDLTVTDIIKGVKKATISRLEGQQLLQDMGYDEAEAKFKLDINIPEEEVVTEVAARELTKADILRLYRAGEIDKAEALSRLMSIRLSNVDSLLLLDLIDHTKTAIPDERQRELTKVDVVKGVKSGYITPEEGYIMLLDVGYTPTDAQFILAVRAEVIVGSPDTFNEFKRITQAYKASQGLKVETITEERIQAERDVNIAIAALSAGKIAGLKPKRLAELERAAEDAKIAYHLLPSTSTGEAQDSAL